MVGSLAATRDSGVIDISYPKVPVDAFNLTLDP
jgi:hypothetical protein